MYIGHINLEKSLDDTGEHFIDLIEALQTQGVRQYVVVRNGELAKRLEALENVTVGPLARSPVTAHSLIPYVDVVHIHDNSGWQAGLLLILTKSIPFVLTEQESATKSRNPIVQSVYKRAAGRIARGDLNVAEHLLIYRHAVDSLRVPTMLL